MYEIRPHPDAVEQIAALPGDARASYEDAVKVMSLVPWNGRPINPRNPDGAVRLLVFPGGMVTYLILEDQQRVDVLTVHWAD